MLVEVVGGIMNMMTLDGPDWMVIELPLYLVVAWVAGRMVQKKCGKSGILFAPHPGGIMQAHRFHLILTTGLAICLGAAGAVAILPTVAIGYPAGSAVSMGNNPIHSWGGSTASADVLTAPADQDLVITDVHLSCNYMCETRVQLQRSDGTSVGMFWVSGGYGSSYDSLSIQQMFSSGLRIPAGQSMNLTSSTGTAVAYTFSGYQAQP